MISLRDVVTGFGNRDPLAEVWRRDLRGGGSSAEITGTLPLSFSGRGKPLTDYLISGNTIQNGTPKSEAPVDVAGCGVWDETRQSYKLPPTVNGTEYPIYLGQCESTRRIRKLVLTGEENWSLWESGQTDVERYYYKWGKTTPSDYGLICTHFRFIRGDGNYEHIRIGGNNFDDFIIFISKTIAPTVADFKSYLADQYAAGTPVTVWYVRATPETAVVNEPLMKIGDYADTVSFAQAGVTIPTASGANILDMTSPVKPSEVYIKGKGIKPTGYGQLVDKNGVRILDKNNVRILVHGQ